MNTRLVSTKKKILPVSFFSRPTLVVARELIGKFLVRNIAGKEIALMIKETEGYSGYEDMASKAFRGQTPGNTPMFGEPGTLYVYFTYGAHWMLNVVTHKEGYPAAVLIRAAGDVVGPGRLTKALGIDKNLNTKLISKKIGLWFEDRGVVVKKSVIQKTPRIGIDSSGPIWSKKLYRFVLKK